MIELPACEEPFLLSTFEPSVKERVRDAMALGDIAPIIVVVQKKASRVFTYLLGTSHFDC